MSSHTLLETAKRILDGDHRMGGFLSIPLLRGTVALPAGEFDTLMADLVKARKVDLYWHDYPASLTAAQRAEHYQANGRVYNGLSIR